MKRISLTKGKSALVSDCDYKYLMQWKWHFDGHYARRSFRRGGRKTNLRMHRVVASQMMLSRTKDVDHRNKNKLDYRRRNLRSATEQQQVGNQSLRSTNTSGYRGVVWDKERSKWRAQIKVKGKYELIDRFKSKREAARAYNKRALEVFGKFATLNKVK